ncbi:MFS transporter [Seonamhaeicola algicola]|uniref:MFS transporter n=1 Tax=Seonamhaeicola algicola TaxID=1719036 RepID=A0A5C7AUD1_9FLAO|nr:MFS transporter [Seonamhaeicola algicola]
MIFKEYILPIIVIAQFCCTSLWFAGNAISKDLALIFNLNTQALGHLTTAVQFGFIIGTFLFALFTVVDRFSPSKVFFVCACIASVFNLFVFIGNHTVYSLSILRFFTGFFLAGIYPVGMKIAADYYKEGLGKSLGFLVGALVLGTAFPHLLNYLSISGSVSFVIFTTSILAVLGGLLVLSFVSNGPYRAPLQRFDFKVVFNVFSNKKFRVAAFGYFGHMWELYAFWAFVPFVLKAYKTHHDVTGFSISMLSFLIIAIGGLACVISGKLSQIYTAKIIATGALLLSCFCCLVSPLFFMYASKNIFLVFMMFWGMVVIADSPLFSALVAQSTPNSKKGTALTIVNCIGFSVTIFSIQLLNYATHILPVKYLFLMLAIGPLLALFVLLKQKRG